MSSIDAICSKAGIYFIVGERPNIPIGGKCKVQNIEIVGGDISTGVISCRVHMANGKCYDIPDVSLIGYSDQEGR